MAVAFRVVVVMLGIGLCWRVAPAVAQVAPGPKWEIEVHGGGLFTSDPTSGTPIAQFPAGPPIPTGFLTSTSRAVPSWYFGDGALLLNQNNASFQVSPRLTPLDGALKQRLARRERGLDVGFRIARTLTPRFLAEFNFDYSPIPLRLTREATDAIEASRATFITAWQGLLSTSGSTNRVVTSTSEFSTDDGHEIAATGALRIRFATRGRLHPYATAGGGMLFYDGSAPGATLTGDYGFSFGPFPINERDAVTVGVRTKDRVPVGLFGGGFEYGFSARQGIRADVRLHVSENTIETVVSANPSTREQSPPFAITTPFPPTIQFSNSRSINRPSSLSGAPVTDLVTFTGTGLQTQTSLTVGYFVRF